MRKSWGLTQKIARGHKTIESRWYMNRRVPWGKIGTGDAIYFKNTGEQITLKATVKKVLAFENLTPIKVRQLLERYGKQDGISDKDIPHYIDQFKDKRYCLLIFLKDVQGIEPFSIDKSGYGAMTAWICVPSIEDIRIAPASKKVG